MGSGLLFGIAILAAVAAGALMLMSSKKGPAPTFPYQKEANLFSPAERSFLGCWSKPLGTSIGSWPKCV